MKLDENDQLMNWKNCQNPDWKKIVDLYYWEISMYTVVHPISDIGGFISNFSL